jgi:hypothetical protein
MGMPADGSMQLKTLREEIFPGVVIRIWAALQRLDDRKADGSLVKVGVIPSSARVDQSLSQVYNIRGNVYENIAGERLVSRKELDICDLGMDVCEFCTDGQLL